VTPRQKSSGDGIACVTLSLCLNRIGFNKDYIIDAVFKRFHCTTNQIEPIVGAKVVS
jgi:hypothetical protein